MKYFYSSSVMGYGLGRKWHSLYKFPKLQIVSKTVTIKPKVGMPFAVIRWGNSVWNRIGLHNMGFDQFCATILRRRNVSELIVSIAGYDHELTELVDRLNSYQYNIAGIELNLSCPNITDRKNISIPHTDYPLYLKLNYTQDPYSYDLNDVCGIRLNSIPTIFGGLSGRLAQEHNWNFIKKFTREGLNVAGCSFINGDDIKKLWDMGCAEMGIGSAILINPKFVESIKGG